MINQKEDLPTPSKSEIIRQEAHLAEKEITRQELPTGKHDPVLEKPSKTFSIKEVISEEKNPIDRPVMITEPPATGFHIKSKDEFSPVAFEAAWQEFTDQLKGDGTRIISMFRSLKPEVGNDKTIKIHLSNAAQKDTFVQIYKQRLITFLENKFILSGIDVDTIVDLPDTNDILYSDEQKSTYLFTKYPILKEMKRAFNLDLT